MRPLPFFLRSIQTPLFLALLYRGTRCVSAKMSLYCHSILLKNEQKFAKIRKRPRVRKSEKGLKIKGFQGSCANEEIIVTMLPKPRRRVRVCHRPPSSCTQKDAAAKSLEVSRLPGFFAPIFRGVTKRCQNGLWQIRWTCTFTQGFLSRFSEDFSGKRLAFSLGKV